MKFSRLARRGILLGLSLAQLVALGVGGLTLVGALYAGGGILIAYTAPVWALSRSTGLDTNRGQARPCTGSPSQPNGCGAV